MAQNVPLPKNQSVAIAALLSSRSLEDAAATARVSSRTLRRWLRKDDFRASLAMAEGEAIAAATRALVRLSALAVDSLEAVLQDGEASAAARVRAASTILDCLLKLRSLNTVEERLARLEEAVAGFRKKELPPC